MIENGAEQSASFSLNTLTLRCPPQAGLEGPSGLARMAWVYILQCADGSYYTGMTRGEEPDGRLSEHLLKLSPGAYTASRLPVKLVYSEYFDPISDAIFAERKIKGWSRAKKEALIRGDWFEVQRLSKRRGGRERALS